MLVRFFNFCSNAIIPTGSSELFLGTILSESTIKTRRWLLSSSLICLLITYAEIVPTKISALGIEFSSKNQASLLKVFSFVLIYFLITFLVSTWSDYVLWRIKIISNRKDYYERIKNQLLEDKVQTEPSELQQHKANHLQEAYIDKIDDSAILVESSILPLTIIKSLWEIVLPIVIAVISVSKLLTFF